MKVEILQSKVFMTAILDPFVARGLFYFLSRYVEIAVVAESKIIR
jgi:hypothetical protein